MFILESSRGWIAKVGGYYFAHGPQVDNHCPTYSTHNPLKLWLLHNDDTDLIHLYLHDPLVLWLAVTGQNQHSIKMFSFSYTDQIYKLLMVWILFYLSKNKQWRVTEKNQDWIEIVSALTLASEHLVQVLLTKNKLLNKDLEFLANLQNTHTHI